MSDDRGYAHPELLAETEWLAEHLDDPSVRIVDTGKPEEYGRAHIPNAVHIGWNYIKDPDNTLHVLPPAKFEELMSSLGIGNDTTVVAYDQDGAHMAARLWWVLDYYGHSKVKVLNGGWNKWLKEGRAVTMKTPQFPRARFSAKPNPDKICRLDEVKGSISKPGVVLLDVRSDGEWDGSMPRENKRGGRIPDAVHVEWRKAVTSDDVMTFRPAAELRKLYESHGVTPDKQVTTY